MNLASLGGISTGAGGNVTLTAKQNVTSYLPNNAASGDAGAGAFGSGNVTILAGGNVTGHYVVADGTGVIGTSLNPVANAGTSQAQLALSLTDGSWSVDALQNIVLQEVRNPNGIFNLKGNPPPPPIMNSPMALPPRCHSRLIPWNFPGAISRAIPARAFRASIRPN